MGFYQIPWIRWPKREQEAPQSPTLPVSSLTPPATLTRSLQPQKRQLRKQPARSLPASSPPPRTLLPRRQTDHIVPVSILPPSHLQSPVEPQKWPKELFFEPIERKESQLAKPAKPAGTRFVLPRSLVPGLQSNQPIRRRPLAIPEAATTESPAVRPQVSPNPHPQSTQPAELLGITKDEPRSISNLPDINILCQKPLPELPLLAELVGDSSQSPRIVITQVAELPGKSATTRFDAEEFARLPSHYDVCRREESTGSLSVMTLPVIPPIRRMSPFRWNY